MNNWTIMAPHASLRLTGSSDMHTALERLPGVKFKAGLWKVPFNAAGCVAEVVAHHEGQCSYGAWDHMHRPAPTWEEVEETLTAAGEVEPWVLDGFLTPYQRDAVAFGWNREGTHFWHSTGAGKTLTGILTALSAPADQPVIVVTRAASRLQYAREIERFLRVRAFVVRPEGSGPVRVKGESWNGFRGRHKGQGLSTADMGKLWKAHQEKYGIDQGRTLEVFVSEQLEKGVRPFVVVGWEALANNLKRLLALAPGAVIYDESHRGKSTKRWDVIHLPDLPDDMEERREQQAEDQRRAKMQEGFIKTTDDGRKMFLPILNTASAAARLSRAVSKRICTTATPIKDRVRDLWAQLDLAEPNAWGNSTAWRKRYCDMKPGKYGGMDDRGSSNLGELNERLRTVAHILTYAETHRHLPPKRRQSIYIAPEDQCRPTAGFAKEIREASKRSASAVLEVKLAQAGSSKRRAVLSMIEDNVRSKQKVVVFTGRRRDCEDLGDRVRKAVKGTQVWSAHGGQTTEHRQEIVDAYMRHPGPCVLVGTGHAFGESLNIDDTDAAYFVMLPYTPGQLRQWEGRFHRASTKKSVVITYVIAEGTVDEHIASILIDKLPAVESVAKDAELAEAGPILGGINEDESDDEFAASVLSFLDD